MGKYTSPYNALHNDNVIRMATNENPYTTNKDFIPSLLNELININRYPDVELTELRNQLAMMHSVDDANIILGAGSDEIITMITMSHITPGDETIMSDPSFFRYKQATENMGGICHMIKSIGYHHDLIAMRNAISSKTKIIFICNPNNPTGTFIPLDEIECFLSKVPNSILVVVDEAYFEYVENNKFSTSINLIKKHSNLIILRSFSKFYGLAGLRVGYALSSPNHISQLNPYKSPYNINSIAIAAATIALENHERYFLKNYLKNFIEEKRFFYKKFRELNIEYIPTQSNFILVDFADKTNALTDYLKSKNIAIRSCEMFNLPRHVRITIGSKEDNIRLFSEIEVFLSGEVK